MPYQALADTVLLLHFGVVVIVALGLPVILLGNRLGWFWVNRLWWRYPPQAKGKQIRGPARRRYAKHGQT